MSCRFSTSRVISSETFCLPPIQQIAALWSTPAYRSIPVGKRLCRVPSASSTWDTLYVADLGNYCLFDLWSRFVPVRANHFTHSLSVPIAVLWKVRYSSNAPCPMPHAPCPMPHAPCPRTPHVTEKGYTSTFTSHLKLPYLPIPPAFHTVDTFHSAWYKPS